VLTYYKEPKIDGYAFLLCYLLFIGKSSKIIVKYEIRTYLSLKHIQVAVFGDKESKKILTAASSVNGSYGKN
jgi:hypothetical protein